VLTSRFVASRSRCSALPSQKPTFFTLRDHARMGWTEIGKKLNIDRRTCQKIYQRAKHRDGSPSNRKRPGRPPTFDDAEKKWLIDFVTRDARTRRLTYEAICIELGYSCTPRTVRNVLASMGYHKRVPRRTFNIRPANKPKRVAWCQAHLHWTYEEWKRILWTDESSFSTSGFGHRPWVIRRPDEEFHPDCLDETFEQGRQSRMAWGGFWGSKKTRLVFIPGKAKLDSKTYVETVMEPHLVPFWQECCEEYGWVKVVEDGAPGHKGCAKEYRDLNELDTIEWPAQSPDLNLIEALWLDLETELGETWGRIATTDFLEASLQATWERIADERLDGLIKSMPARLQAVIDAGGGAPPY
jgi:transposase